MPSTNFDDELTVPANSGSPARLSDLITAAAGISQAVQFNDGLHLEFPITNTADVNRGGPNVTGSAHASQSYVPGAREEEYGFRDTCQIYLISTSAATQKVRVRGRLL